MRPLLSTPRTSADKVGSPPIRRRPAAEKTAHSPAEQRYSHKAHKRVIVRDVDEVLDEPRPLHQTPFAIGPPEILDEIVQRYEVGAEVS